MIKNDLPQGVLKESKYQKSKKTLKIIGFCLIIAGVLASILMFVMDPMGGDAKKADTKTSAYDQLLSQEKAAFDEKQAAAKTAAELFKTEAASLADKIDAEKQAILPDYDLVSFTSITSAQNVELARVDRNYQSEIDAMKQRASAISGGVNFDCQTRVKCKVTDAFGRLAEIAEGEEFNPNRDGSMNLIRLKMDAGDAEFMAEKSILFTVIPAIIPLILLGGAGGIVLFFAHQREVAAFGAQGILPVASEATGKMVKSLDDNGTLDIIAKTGSKIMGTSAKSRTKKSSK